MKLNDNSMRAHRHNGLLGNCGIIRTHLNVIRQSPTATPTAKVLADELEAKLRELYQELYDYRQEADLSIVKVRRKPIEGW